MARSRAATLIKSADSEFAEIIAWYEEQLDDATPPTGLLWEPVKIGPTWQWDENGWVLPEASLGWRVLAWAGKWLRDKRGQPWQFTPEQTRFILWFFAVDENGGFLYHSAVLQRLKGWGKDPVAACLALAACFAEVTFDHWDGDRPIGREEPNAWVQIVAVNQEQTKNTMKLLPSLVPAETRQHYGIQIGKVNLYGLGDTRQIEAVTSSAMAIEGGRPTLIIRGETQNWNSSNGGHEMAGAIEGNAAKSEDGTARMLDICNAFRPNEGSVGQVVREAWEATQGEESEFQDFGLLYDSLEAPPKAPLSAEAAPDVVRAIAGDSTWLDTKPRGRIVKSILNSANPPSESRRKWYNQITAAEDAWVVPQDWDANADPRVLERGDRIVMFFDGSKSDDATALVGCRMSDGYIFRIGIWQRGPKDKDWIVNRDAVDVRVHETFAKYSVVGFWADLSDARDDETGERYWEPYADAWAQKYAQKLRLLPAVKSGDSAHLINWDMRSPAHMKVFIEHAERFTSDVKNGATEGSAGVIPHDGDKILQQHVKNARRRPARGIGVGLGKEHRESKKKIDGAVCAVGARMMWRIAIRSGIKATSRSRKAVTL